MRFKLYKNGSYFNTVIGEENFVKAYAETNGLTYEVDATDKPVTVEELVLSFKLLKAQFRAQTERSDFIEDCIAEMAVQVYGGV